MLLRPLLYLNLLKKIIILPENCWESKLTLEVHCLTCEQSVNTEVVVGYSGVFLRSAKLKKITGSPHVAVPVHSDLLLQC